MIGSIMIAHIRSGVFLLLFPFLFSCTHYYQQSHYENQQVRVLEDQQADSSLVGIIEPYKSKIDKEMNEVIGEFGMELTRARPESSLGNFVCDMLLAEGELADKKPIDFAVYNYGGIRLDAIGEGPVTRGKIFELLPFENFAVVVTLDGVTTAQLIQKVVDEGGWPVGGIRLQINNNKAEQIYIHDLPFDTEKTYRVIMNDYMANGGDNMQFLVGRETTFLNMTIRDMAIHYITTQFQQGKKIISPTDGRITDAK